MGRKLLYFLLTLGILYKSTFSIPLVKVTDDDTETAATSNEEEEEEDAESGDEGSGSKKDEIANSENDETESEEDDGVKKDEINDNPSSDDTSEESDNEAETASDERNSEEDDEKSDETAKKEEVPSANEEEEDQDDTAVEDSDEDEDNEEDDHEKRSGLSKRYYDHHDHEGREHGHHHEHEHGHHEHEHEHHHHGHHHGFIHEWGQEEGGEHHGHEGHGHHEHDHHHDHDHEHHHGHHQEHHGHHGEEDGYGWGRSNLPLAYHCRDMVSRTGDNKAATKRFCVPIGYHTNYGIQYFHSYPGNTGYSSYNLRSSIIHAEPETNLVVADQKIQDLNINKQRDQIAQVSQKETKKQTVHVGYGYASGDNYRLGYQEGGMGGLASTFSGGSVGADHGPDNFDGPDHFKKSSMPMSVTHDVQATKRYFPAGQAGFPGGFNGNSPATEHGSATPYGHPVTHPGFTTMGFPGHALASADVRNKINHPKVKRQIFGPDQFPQQQPPQFASNMGGMMEQVPPQMEAPGGPNFQSMMGQVPEPENLPMGMSQEEMGAMRSMLPRYPGDPSVQQFQQLAGYSGYRGRRYVSLRENEE